MPKITRLKPRPTRQADLFVVSQDVIDSLRDVLPDAAFKTVQETLSGVRVKKKGRGFVRLYLDTSKTVRLLLKKHVSRNVVARDVLEAMFVFLSRNSQEVLADREKLAAEAGTSVTEVSRALVSLEKFNIIWREAGRRHIKRIFLNPRLASYLPEDAWLQEVARAPLIEDPDAPRPQRAQLRLVEPAA